MGAWGTGSGFGEEKSSARERSSVMASKHSSQVARPWVGAPHRMHSTSRCNSTLGIPLLVDRPMWLSPSLLMSARSSYDLSPRGIGLST